MEGNQWNFHETVLTEFSTKQETQVHMNSPYSKLIVELSALAGCFDIRVEFHQSSNQIRLYKRMVHNLKFGNNITLHISVAYIDSR